MCNFIWSEQQTQEAVARRLGFDYAFGSDALGDKNPTDQICVALPFGLAMCRWSLIPRWSKEVPQVLMTNARSETLAVKPSFQHLLEGNRCLVGVTGFYEWFMGEKTAISRKDGAPMYLAGLWDEWRGMKSATMVTTEPSDWMRDYQDRMPLVLEDGELEVWLRGEWREAEKLITVRDPEFVGEVVSGQQRLFDI